MLQLVKIKESDVCRSLVLSNSVTYVTLQETANTHNTLISNIICESCVGTRRLCSLFYLLCYAALLKILPIMLKLCSLLYLSSHTFLINLQFMGKQ